MATRIVNNRIRQVNISDIQKLCVILKCTPNDFFDWIPGNNDFDIEHHPLNAIKRSDKIVQLAQLVNNIPMDRLADIENLILKEMEK
jgi:succinate dehydrogenase flavin-adding protein (antitoxin of CptAB toxin-antitoxin module)